MNALHLTIEYYAPDSGVRKKIQAQADAINNHGYNHTFIGLLDADSTLKIDEQIITIMPSQVRQIKNFKKFFDIIIDFIIDNDISFVYYRFNAMSEPSVISFFHKLKSIGVKCIMEIPTYPYDGERTHLTKLTILDRLTRRFLAKQFEYIITFSDKQKIFGNKTITISNGVDIRNIDVKKNIEHKGFVMLGVANLSDWHGFDRMLLGMYNYLNKFPAQKESLIFHIVSGEENECTVKLRNLSINLGLYQNVVFHGKVIGKDLDYLFDISDVAIGSLGRHRNNIKYLKTLKNVEYAVRGIPFIYSEYNDDFDNQKYILKAPMDDSPVDIEKIINFVYQIELSPSQIRQTAVHLSWDDQFDKIFNKLNQ